MSEIFENAENMAKGMKSSIIKVIVAEQKIECLFNAGKGLTCDSKPLEEKAITKDELKRQIEPLFEIIDDECLKIISRNNELKDIAAGALALRCGGG